MICIFSSVCRFYFCRGTMGWKLIEKIDHSLIRISIHWVLSRKTQWRVKRRQTYWL